MVVRLLLWLLAALGAAVLLLLFAPLRVYMNYREGETAAHLKILWFFRLNLYPIPEKKPKKKKERAEKEAPEKPPAPDERGGLHRLLDLWGTLNDLLPIAGRGLGYIFRRLTVRRCFVTILVGEEDAGDTAIRVGQIYAAGYNLYAVLCSLVRMKDFHLHVTPDYTGPGQKAAAELILSVRPSTVLAGGLIFLVRWLGMLIRNNLNKTSEQRTKARRHPAAT